MAEEKQIRIYHTHIEVYPYQLGECETIEKQMSVWVEAEFRYEPLSYFVHDDTLYLPRGFNINILENHFNSTSFIIHKCDPISKVRGIKMLVPPRDKIQEESLDFLLCRNTFENRAPFSQQVLTLDTGRGKTYVTINAIVSMGEKAIIITHQEKIKKQWIETFYDKTNISDEDLLNVKNSSTIKKILAGKLKAKYYFVNHQTLTSFANSNGWNRVHDFFETIKVGIKVYDEAHLSFKNIMLIDFFSDTKKTFYLTATFGRSDEKENRIFKKCFNAATKFGQETSEYEENRKHIIYVPVLYRSNPTYNHLRMASNAYGFSVLGFNNYALHCDEEQTMLNKFFHIFDMCCKLEGKILITIPVIKDVEMIKEKIQKEYPYMGKTIGTIHSNNDKETNEYAKSCDIICSTIKSSGTGVDIKGLRCIINLEPFSSKVTCNQLAGRLREYAKDKDTYFFDLIDIAFPVCERQHKTRIKHLNKKCKSIQIMKLM